MEEAVVCDVPCTEVRAMIRIGAGSVLTDDVKNAVKSWLAEVGAVYTRNALHDAH